MKREGIMTTYKNILTANRSWDMVRNANKISVDKNVILFAEKHGKKEAYLYNNRLFFGQINPTEKHKEQYNVNWNYINSL